MPCERLLDLRDSVDLWPHCSDRSAELLSPTPARCVLAGCFVKGWCSLGCVGGAGREALVCVEYQWDLGGEWFCFWVLFRRVEFRLCDLFCFEMTL